MRNNFYLRLLILGTFVCSLATDANADVTLPNIFSDHMVLQQKNKNKVWGKAEPGEEVTVTFSGNAKRATASADGTWSLELEPLPAGGPHELVVEGKNSLTFKDVLVGEVWICSGQSNMEWPVNGVNDADLVKAGAKNSRIRMISYPNVGTQTPVWTHHDASWIVCSPENVGPFSAVAYFFGKQLQETIQVPIGLINNSWGGSAAEAWVDADVLAQDSDYAKSFKDWKSIDEEFATLSTKKDPTKEELDKLGQLKEQLGNNRRPANLYNGILKSHIGYGIKGAIWYQGETNAEQAYKYRELFPMLIQNWRDVWGQGDFPFYWVQLADFTAEEDQPKESAWAELREAQTMTMAKLPNTGEAVIIDVGEGYDIHPHNKATVGQRLARWALANQYGVPIAYRSPMYESMKVEVDKIILSFKDVAGGWRPFDVQTPIGFAIAGADKKFAWADAKVIDGNKIEVSSAAVKEPVAVRYAWANNPRCNMFNGLGMPLTPFRTDDWPGITVNNR